jgi:hypothetical protein
LHAASAEPDVEPEELEDTPAPPEPDPEEHALRAKQQEPTKSKRAIDFFIS